MFCVGVAIARSDNINKNSIWFNHSRNCAMVSEIIVGFAQKLSRLELIPPSAGKLSQCKINLRFEKQSK